MTAEQARRIANDHLEGPATKDLLKRVHQKIEREAKKGLFCLNHQLDGVKGGIAPQVKDALWLALKSEGYIIVHHRNPDPVNAAVKPYTIISW